MLGKNVSKEHGKEKKIIPGKVATTRTEDGITKQALQCKPKDKGT